MITILSPILICLSSSKSFASSSTTVLLKKSIDSSWEAADYLQLFKTFNYGNDLQSKTFSKFLTSIIVALSIESLMAVFKIVLDDYSKPINAFYLIIGVTLLIVGTGIYNRLSAKVK